MFLKVLNKLNFGTLTQTQISYFIIDLLLLATPLELLAINHRSSESRIVFVPQLLKLSYVLAIL